MIRRTRLIYAVLVLGWGVLIAWQIAEHNRVKESARADLRSRAKEIANTLSAIIRGLQFRGAVIPERLEPVLAELVGGRTNEVVKSGELISIALLNAAGTPLASAGHVINLQEQEIEQVGERWGLASVTLVYPVVGASLASEGATNPTVILPPRRDFTNAVGDAARRFGRPEPRPGDPSATNAPPGTAATNSVPASARPGAPGEAGRPPFGRPDGPPPGPPPDRDGDGRPREGELGPRRPWWARRMEEREYQSLIEKRALHGLVLAMSTETVRAASVRDLWMRWIITSLGSVAVLGLATAWRNLAKSSELELRLVRAAELNSRLKEMNLAAAGLAHETKNPLNIIRGLAQMMSRREDAPPEVRQKAREMVDETDRVTAQLNEFINYSRPREVRRSVLALSSVVGEVVRALNFDIEEKRVRLSTFSEELLIEADEQLLRQALFNLVLNAIQAVEPQGEIQIRAGRNGGAEAFLEIRDNGPGVPVDRRNEIFKPYFTTHPKGTGLGLAVVQQIVLAHGWEIGCLANEPRGAVFRIDHLPLATKATWHAA
jgi:signal transduction histidine kinase